MLISSISSTILFTIIIALVAVGGTGELWAAVVLMFFIVFVQTFGWQANKFLSSSEIAPLEYRHIGGAFFASGEWLMVFITVMAGPIGLATCGWPFWFFILSGNIVGIVFVYLLCPETAGKTLEEGKCIDLKELCGVVRLIVHSGLLVRRTKPCWIAKEQHSRHREY